jgi:hypothetical protein
MKKKNQLEFKSWNKKKKIEKIIKQLNTKQEVKKIKQFYFLIQILFYF